MFVLKDLNVTLENVLGQTIDGEVLVTFLFSTATAGKGPFTLNKGTNVIPLNLTIPGGPTSELVITLRNDHYAKAVVRVRIFKADDFAWDHPGATCTLIGSTLSVRIVMIRVRQAPISPINKGLKSDVEKHPDNNVLPFLKKNGLSEPEVSEGVWDDPDITAQRYWGLESLHMTLNFNTIKNNGGVPIKDAKATEWNRFHFERHSIKPRDTGGFLWLEYGAVENKTNSFPRFLVALWVPKREGNKPVDVIVNFSHGATAWNLPGSEFPYRKTYPYTITKVSGTTPGHPQAYVHFGLSYLLDAPSFAFHFIGQSLASGKPVVIINPIFPMDPKSERFGKPFTTQQGLYRLVLEVQQFLYQEGYSMPGGIHLDEWQGRSARAGLWQNPNVIIKNFIRQNPPILKTRNITLTAHSSGLKFVTGLIGQSSLPKGTDYPFDIWGASDFEFKQHWKEIWDLDLAHAGDKSVSEYLDIVLAWYKRGDRVLRIYRSMHTNSGPKAFDKVSAIATIQLKESNAGATAVYWHNDRHDISFMWMNNGYTTSASPSPDLFRVFLKSTAEWWRFHQVPAILGFGHACKLRANS
jgi:hypothetical protein